MVVELIFSAQSLHAGEVRGGGGIIAQPPVSQEPGFPQKYLKSNPV
jgi:hypothetical protein